MYYTSLGHNVFIGLDLDGTILSACGYSNSVLYCLKSDNYEIEKNRIEHLISVCSIVASSDYCSIVI